MVRAFFGVNICIILCTVNAIKGTRAAPAYPVSNLNRASDELKGINPASGSIPALSAHPFESLCRDHRGLSGNLAPTNCGLPYDALASASGRPYCSGLLAASLPGMICGACLEVTYKTKKTYVRYIDQSGGAFDISYSNYLDIGEPEDYALSSQADRSGAGTNMLYGATYKEVHGSHCDAYWDGRCSNMIVPDYSGANRAMAYSCIP